MVSLLGSALQAGATNMAMLIIGRFIGGVAVGMLTSTIPMYASEISIPKWRGALSGLLQWFLSWGFLVAQWLGYGCSFTSGAFSCKPSQASSSLEYMLIPSFLQGDSPWHSNASPPSYSCPVFGSCRSLPAGSWKRISTMKPVPSSISSETERIHLSLIWSSSKSGMSSLQTEKLAKFLHAPSSPNHPGGSA